MIALIVVFVALLVIWHIIELYFYLRSFAFDFFKVELNFTAMFLTAIYALFIFLAASQLNCNYPQEMFSEPSYLKICLRLLGKNDN